MMDNYQDPCEYLCSEPDNPEELFWKWFRLNHPFSWFAKETGEPVDQKYRLFIAEFVRKAYLDGRQEQKEKDAEMVEFYARATMSQKDMERLLVIAKAIRES